MQETYTVKYDLTWSEYFNLSIYMLSRMRIIRRIVVLVPVICLISALLGNLAPGRNGPEGMRAYLSVLEAIVGVCGFFLVATLLMTAIVSLFKPDIIRGQSYRFSAAGMERITPAIQVTIPWTEFYAIRESRSFFWLHMRRNNVEQVHVVQKRMFPDGASAQEFKTYIERHLSL